MTLKDYLNEHLETGRIEDISRIICEYFNVRHINQIKTEDKLDALCIAADISRSEMDLMIASNSGALRTISGHVFEIIFSKILQINDIPHEEIGGDSDYDFKIGDVTLQLKAPNKRGCTSYKMSYKTHKTHGSKSKKDGIDYYHNTKDFADFLIGLISYNPFRVFVIPKADIPRVEGFQDYLASPFDFELCRSDYINAFEKLGIADSMIYPNLSITGASELLPLTAKTIGTRSNYIIDAIYQPGNFRIWDMNLRGFIREQHFSTTLRMKGIQIFNPKKIVKVRAEKIDLLLRNKNKDYVSFQVKGLTIASCKFAGSDSIVCCETQLSRGRANDHPTQSRLYYRSDFQHLLIAMDPVYTSHFSEECFGKRDNQWSFYDIPVDRLKAHHKYPSRLASNQSLKYTELQQYRISDGWFNQWL